MWRVPFVNSWRTEVMPGCIFIPTVVYLIEANCVGSQTSVGSFVAGCERQVTCWRLVKNQGRLLPC